MQRVYRLIDWHTWPAGVCIRVLTVIPIRDIELRLVTQCPNAGPVGHVGLDRPRLTGYACDMARFSWL